MKKFVRLAGFFIFALALALGGLVARLAQLQASAFIHQSSARYRSEYTPGDYGLKYETLTLTTRDGLRLAAWYVPSRNGAAVILQHGFRGARDGVLPEAAVLARHGYGALLIDARAHGDSEGDLITFGLKEVLDIRAGLDYLLTQRSDVDPDRIGALGESQGAVTILLACAQYTELKACVSDSAYASLQDEIAQGVRVFSSLPPVPFAPLIQFFAEREAGFTAEAVAPIRHIAEIAPRAVFIMHGGLDDTIPPENGQQLCDAAREPKECWFEPDVGHTQFLDKYPKEYEQRVVEFFDHFLLGK